MSCPILTDPGAAAAFAKFLSCREHHDLPWETQEKEMQDIFYAGWAAHVDSLRQTEIPLGDSNATLPPVGSTEPVSIKTETPVSAEDIYNAYPRKVGKQAAIKAILKAKKQLIRDGKLDAGECDGNADYLLGRALIYAATTKSWPAADRQFIPHPATWFNRGSYDDDPKEWVRGYAATTSQFTKAH